MSDNRLQVMQCTSLYLSTRIPFLPWVEDPSTHRYGKNKQGQQRKERHVKDRNRDAGGGGKAANSRCAHVTSHPQHLARVPRGSMNYSLGNGQTRSSHEIDDRSTTGNHMTVQRSAPSLASVGRPPTESEDGVSASKAYKPLSLPVLAMLASASVFGVLARLGLQALATYSGGSVFSLAYPQTVGCFLMGVFLSLKQPIGQL
jgi:hypothetical protein